jgi:hypothetical protein
VELTLSRRGFLLRVRDAVEVTAEVCHNEEPDDLLKSPQSARKEEENKEEENEEDSEEEEPTQEERKEENGYDSEDLDEAELKELEFVEIKRSVRMSVKFTEPEVKIIVFGSNFEGNCARNN